MEVSGSCRRDSGLDRTESRSDLMSTDTLKMSAFARAIMQQKYSHDLPSGEKETWSQIAHRVATNVMAAVDAPPELTAKIERAIAARKFIPGGRYLYASGRAFHQTQNCLLLRAEDSREGWADLAHKSIMALMTGAGIGIVYSDVRPRGSLIKKTGGVATGPCALMQMINECGRGIKQGGDRRSAIWAGLHWNHADVFEFIHLKDWSPEVRALKEKDYNFPAPMDGTNISVILDDDFFLAYEDKEHVNHALAVKVYWEVVRQMLSTAEPGFSIDIGPNRGENCRNACTEITSPDDSDICNLGSINMANVETLEEMQELVEIGTAFLLAGTVYSHIPYAKVGETREKNRRLGLGLMGLHEWLLKRDKKYEPDPELAKFLEVYMMSDVYAREYAQLWELSVPVKTRAIAPNGTIGIVAETTTSGEPILCVAYKRRYLKGNTLHFQYVVDPTAQRLIESGVSPDDIEDAYGLAEDVERRVAFQAWLQRYVDHGISSTVNLPEWGSETNNQYRVRDFGVMLMKYLPHLRGVTCYPDGARGGQPLTKVPYELAVQNLGKVFTEEVLGNPQGEQILKVKALDPSLTMSDEQAARPVDVCDITKGGTCGA